VFRGVGQDTRLNSATTSLKKFLMFLKNCTGHPLYA
jgi:hypothetical protein